MKPIQNSTLILVFFLLSINYLFAQDTASYKIAVLPISSNGIDSISVGTVQSILELAIAQQPNAEVISSAKIKEETSLTECNDSKCAEEIGKQTGATRVLGCKLAALGNNIIVQYFVLDVKSGRDVLLDQVTATGIEDLKPVMERVAKSAVNLKTVSQNAEVGDIYQTEAEKPLRRASRKNVGLSFGYLYPQSGYDSFEKSFVLELSFDYELENAAVGMMIGAHEGFAMNIYGDYLITKTDVCPYIGGAFGFHWVSHSTPSPVYDYSSHFVLNPEKKSADGFELTLNTGLRLLHTYNFQIVINIGYSYSFNDYNDQAIIFTLGIL